MDAELSFVQEHADEEFEFDKLRCLIEDIQSAGENSSADLYTKMSCHADQIMYTVLNHFKTEEAQVSMSLI